MEIIIRSPLLKFDIDDPKSKDANFPDILENIRIASTDFYNAIHNKNYNELSQKEKLSVRKYLIRGKYRATPFGRWAGLGLGVPQNQSPEKFYPATKEKLLLKPKELYKNHILKTQCNVILKTDQFQLGYMMNTNGNGFEFWEFDFLSESWQQTVIENNNVLTNIYEHFQSNATIDFKEFTSWFIDSPHEEIFQCWEKIIKSSFLIYPFQNDPEIELDKQTNPAVSIDVFFKEPIPYNKRNWIF